MSSSSMNNVRDLGRTLIWLIAITLIVIVAMAFVLSRQPAPAASQQLAQPNTVAARAAVTPTVAAVKAVAAAPIRLPAGSRVVAIMVADRSQGGNPPPDFLVLAISRQNSADARVVLLTIPTDTLVDIPGWSAHTIAQAYAHGGPALLKSTIKYNFGLTVSNYVQMDLTAAMEYGDENGGLELFGRCRIDAAVALPNGQTGEVHIPAPAVYTLNAAQAFAYAYAPYSTPDTQVPLGRRGEEVIRGFWRTGVPLEVLRDQARLLKLYNEYKAAFQSDLSALNLYYLFARYHQSGTPQTFSRNIAEAGVTRTSVPDVGSVLVISRANLAAYLNRAVRVLFAQPIKGEISVEVLDGTSQPLLAFAAADRLTELGYYVTNLGKFPPKADHLYDHSVLIDLGAAQTATTSQLQQQFGLQPENVQAQPAAGTRTRTGPQYRFIVGADYNPCAY